MAESINSLIRIRYFKCSCCIVFAHRIALIGMRNFGVISFVCLFFFRFELCFCLFSKCFSVLFCSIHRYVIFFTCVRICSNKKIFAWWNHRFFAKVLSPLIFCSLPSNCWISIVWNAMAVCFMAWSW